MRTLLGKLGKAIVGPFLRVVPLFLLISAAFCHAQCYGGPLTVQPDITLTPTYWAPGQSGTVTITNSQGYFYQWSGGNTEYVLTAASYYAGDYNVEDPNVTTSNEALSGTTVITFNMSVAGGAPTENDGFAITCPGEILDGGPGYISITPCAIAPPTPAITSISPNIWVAGQTYAVTITGTGFVPGNNPNSCSSTALSISQTATVPPGSSNIGVSGITVVSPTQITATVTPQAADPAETAYLTVYNYLLIDPAPSHCYAAA